MARATSKPLPTMDDFQRMIRKLGKMVVECINEQELTKRKRTGWESGFIDARWFSDTAEPSRISKVRFTSPGLKQLGGVHTTDEMERLLDKIWVLKESVFTEPWWGLKLIVFPSAKLQLELDSDPNCTVDPLWYET